MDLEAWESCLRRIVLKAGAGVLEELLHDVGCGRRAESVSCECGRAMQSVGLRNKTIQTILGPIRFRRSLYVCPSCGKGCFPGDLILGVQNTGYSPGLRRLMARAGSRTSFADAEDDLREYAGLDIGRKEIQRIAEEVGKEVDAWTKNDLYESGPETDPLFPILYISFDGTGIPIQRRELKGRKGKQSDGTAKTREVKLGCLFTQTTTDADGCPVRDPEATTYTGAIETSQEFGWRIYREARLRGLFHARQAVVLTDGAKYNKTIVETHFPQAVHIIDLYHARENLIDMAKLLLKDPERESLQKEWLDQLDRGAIEELLAAVQHHLPAKGKRRRAGLNALRYFQENAQSMRYEHFRKQGFFVGSGVVEAGCRTLIGQRLKMSGMFWSVAGANAIIASRCSQFSHRFELFWASRAP